MFVRKSLTALTFAAAVSVMAGPALADDGSVRVMQSLKDRVAEALENPNNVPGNVQFAATGTRDNQAGAVRRNQQEFAHEAWRDLPPRR